MTDLYYPLRSLREGHWFKLICGASFQHLPAIQNLVLVYALAGADCIDVAADPAVVSAAKLALDAAARVAPNNPKLNSRDVRSTPWLMVSFNDGEDPHFRKAEFNAAQCPTDCPRPCETICPAEAIVFPASQTNQSAWIDADLQNRYGLPLTEGFAGVISDRCYGCGRCIPVCPMQHITARAYVSTPTAIAPLVLEAGVDAIEIHTQIGRLADFQRLWTAIAPWAETLKLIAISCPDGEGLIDYLWSLHDLISPLPCALVWQTDGRPMSGDIGAGTTRAAVKLGQKVLAAGLPGYVQLAGGTNHHTVAKLTALGLLNPALHPQASSADGHAVANSLVKTFTEPSSYIAGIAYGSYARALLMPILNQLEALAIEDSAESRVQLVSSSPNFLGGDSFTPPVTLSDLPTLLPQTIRLEDLPALLWPAVDLAYSLVSQLKP